MNISGINYESLVDGTGIRTTLFFSGCKWNCPGCHNPECQDFQNGQPFTRETEQNIITKVRSSPYIRGITLSGGDPMFVAAELIPVVKRIKEAIPHIDIWCYTGFSIQGVLKDPTRRNLLMLTDVLVDGPFLLKERDIRLPFRGSRNQKIINVRQTLTSQTVVLLEQY